MKKLGFILGVILTAFNTNVAFADWTCSHTCQFSCQDGYERSPVTGRGATLGAANSHAKQQCEQWLNMRRPRCNFYSVALDASNCRETRPQAQYYSVILKNECRTYGQITTAIRYRDLQNTWVSGGFWTLAYGESATVAHTTNRNFYVHGHTATGQSWGGSDTFEVRGSNYGFRRWTIPEGTAHGAYTFRFTCN